MERRYRWHTLFVLVGAFVSLGVSADDNVSGLRGQRLTETRDASSIIGALAGGGAKIAKVEVVRDAAQLVELDVTYADVTGQKTLRAEVLGRNKRRVPITAAPVEIRNRTGSVRVVLQLDRRQAEGTTVESKTLVLRLEGGMDAATSGEPAAAGTPDIIGTLTGILGGGGGSDRVMPGFTFELARPWTVPVRPENVVVDVTPVAIGSIPASAPSAGGGTTVAPPKIFKANVLPIAVHGLSVAPHAAVVRPHAVVAQPIDARIAVRWAAAQPATAQPVVASAHMATLASTIRIADVAQLRKLESIDRVKGVPRDLQEKGAQGPSNRIIPLFTDVVVAPGTGLDPAKLTTISTNVYQDKNAESGIFYYLPARYTLHWDSDNGYALRTCYSATSGEAQGNVAIGARLTSGIDLSELELLRTLLRAAVQAPAKFNELRPLPIADAPAFSLRNDVQQFNVPPEKVAVAAISDIAGQVDLTITTDTVTKETIEAVLTQGLGLTGTATFRSAGEDAFAATVPVQLRVADPHSFGTRYWQRAQELRNTTPFPLRLKYLHFLTMAPDGTPTVYSYALGDSVVPARGRARLIDGPVMAWLDGKAVKKWIDYSVAERDEAGIAAAKQQFACSGTQTTASTLAVSSLTPFAEPGGIARIIVEVRSRYFEAADSGEQTQSVTLASDNQTQNLRLFLVNRGADSADSLFSYRLSVVRPDGTRSGPGEWRTGDALELFIGSSQVQPLLGSS